MAAGMERRDFLKVVGVGGAGATVAGCSTGEVEKLLPYVTHPEEITPGVATWYTTACGGCEAGCGMWARTREGRAVKLEGNPNHPVSQGALCSVGHASLQHLYNPDRHPGPLVREGDRVRSGGWDEAERFLASKIGPETRVLFLTGRCGPTLDRLFDEFTAAVNGTRVRYLPGSNSPALAAAAIVYGADAPSLGDIGAARTLISFGDDFTEGTGSVEGGRGLARSNALAPDGSKGRFVYVGPRLSATGMNADEWVPVRPGTEALLALGMASAIATDPEAAGSWAPLLRQHTPATTAAATGVEEADIRELAHRFASEGPSLALGPGAGGSHRRATQAHVAVALLNHVAGAAGGTVRVGAGPNPTGSYGEMADAVEAMAAGAVDVVLVHGINPVYEMPRSSGFREAFEQVPFKASFAQARDETSALADLVLPDRHFLESWGDTNPRAGIRALQQPVMQPVPHFDSKQTGDVLLSVAAHLGSDPGASTFFDYLREAYRAEAGEGDFDARWREYLRSGVVEIDADPDPEDTADSAAAPALMPMGAVDFTPARFDEGGDLTLLVHPSPRLGSGEHANQPWLQELPDPASKITWHSWLEINPHTAEERGLGDGDIVSVASAHGTVEVPVWLYPGIREDAVALALGGGHTAMGRWADGNGVNALDLLPSDTDELSGAFAATSVTVTVTPTGSRRALATVSGSDDDFDRPIAPAVALADLGHAEEHEDEHHGELDELQGLGGFVPVPAEDGAPTAFPLEGSRHGPYENSHESEPRWAMAIDLDKCTGCSACVTACQAENNVPWVGEEQLLGGREMSWIRLERYYKQVDATRAGPLDVRFLPMLCQHCGNAPCEPVCPVYATYHTPDGLNAQIYNRCVGTRYCANNCPYKVRVFNWLRYADGVPEPMNWQWNPDVTVRGNGVMEKCSFCVQRIREAENRAALEEGRPVRDGEVVPACQQSCAAEAIVFGNIRDPESRVARVTDDERTYRVLDEFINTQPAVSYLKKVTHHAASSGAGHAP